MTNLLIKGIGFLAVTAFTIPQAYAEEPIIKMQNYTSSISIATCDGHTVTQQVGSPLSYPILLEGGSMLNQGLFGALSKLVSGSSGVGSLLYSPNDGIRLSFDTVNNTLNVDATIDPGKVRIVVMDMAGIIILATSIDESESSILLSELTPGIYIAAVATSNNFFKSIKFTVK